MCVEDGLGFIFFPWTSAASAAEKNTNRAACGFRKVRIDESMGHTFPIASPASRRPRATQGSMRRSPRVVHIAYDLETTGIDTLLDRIVQFAAVVIDPTTGESLHRATLSISSYVNPHPRAMSKGAVRVTGIEPESLHSAPLFADVWRQFQGLVSRACGRKTDGAVGSDAEPGEDVCVCLIGHNSASFDDIMLAAELQRVGIADLRNPAGLAPGSHLLLCDTLRAARAAKKCTELTLPNLKLATIYQHVRGCALEGAHDALVDCEAVGAIMGWQPVRRHLHKEAWSCRLQTLADRRAKRGMRDKRKAPCQIDGRATAPTRRRPDLPKSMSGPPNGPTSPAAPPPGPAPHRACGRSALCAGCGSHVSLYFTHMCMATNAG